MRFSTNNDYLVMLEAKIFKHPKHVTNAKVLLNPIMTLSITKSGKGIRGYKIRRFECQNETNFHQ